MMAVSTAVGRAGSRAAAMAGSTEVPKVDCLAAKKDGCLDGCDVGCVGCDVG